jgi:hypothetical protein
MKLLALLVLPCVLSLPSSSAENTPLLNELSGTVGMQRDTQTVSVEEPIATADDIEEIEPSEAFTEAPQVHAKALTLKRIKKTAISAAVKAIPTGTFWGVERFQDRLEEVLDGERAGEAMAIISAMYAIACSLSAAEGAVLGSAASACLAKTYSTSALDSIKTVAPLTILAFFTQLQAAIAIMVASVGASSAVAMCTDNQLCQEASVQFMQFVEHSFPVLASSAGGAMACWFNGDSPSQGAAAGAFYGLYGSIRNRCRQEYPKINRLALMAVPEVLFFFLRVLVTFLTAETTSGDVKTGMILGAFNAGSLAAIKFNKDQV